MSETPDAPEAIRKFLKGWAQTLTIACTLFYYGSQIEHRFTALEKTVEAQAQAIEDHHETLELMRQQIQEDKIQLKHLIDLEDFIHGMTPDEELGYRRRKSKASKEIDR